MGKDGARIIREFFSRAGRKGGKARARKYDKATRSQWARLGAEARWSKQRKSKAKGA
ncbi:MAG TPA: hypothetical protein VKV79_03000 [Terriglobia bacterium]|nr:hypothetical protein [Terriglobia bacterium]